MFFRRDCETCILRVPWEKLMKLMFFLKTKLTIIFKRAAKICQFLSKLFQRGCQNCIIHVQKKFHNEVFCYKNCYLSNKLGTSIELFPHSWQFFPGWIVETACYASVGKAWTKFFELKIFHQLRTLSEKISIFVKIFPIELTNLPSRCQ